MLGPPENATLVRCQMQGCLGRLEKNEVVDVVRNLTRCQQVILVDPGCERTPPEAGPRPATLSIDDVHRALVTLSVDPDPLQVEGAGRPPVASVDPRLEGFRDCLGILPLHRSIIGIAGRPTQLVSADLFALDLRATTARDAYRVPHERPVQAVLQDRVAVLDGGDVEQHVVIFAGKGSTCRALAPCPA